MAALGRKRKDREKLPGRKLKTSQGDEGIRHLKTCEAGPSLRDGRIFRNHDGSGKNQKVGSNPPEKRGLNTLAFEEAGFPTGL